MKRASLGVGAIVAVAWLVAIGCGVESSAIGGGNTEAGEDSGGSEGAAPDDAGSGGEPVGDGGANVDPDAGEDDAGGPCSALPNDAPPVVSTCISTSPQLNGGALVAGKYFLTGVAALAGPAFCQGSFVPTGFRETMELSLAGNVATLETVVSIAGGPERRRTTTATPGAGDTSPATATATCPAGPTARARYASLVTPAGRRVLLLLLPYGAGAAIYRFGKQP